MALLILKAWVPKDVATIIVAYAGKTPYLTDINNKERYHVCKISGNQLVQTGKFRMVTWDEYQYLIEREIRVENVLRDKGYYWP